MTEIISLQIGHFGDIIGSSFWQDLYLEHCIDAYGNVDYPELDPSSNLDVFLYEDLHGAYKPRTLLIDSDPDDCGGSGIFLGRPLIETSNIVKGSHGTQKNFALGRSDKELIENVMEKVRKLAEQSQSLQGFQFFHSIGGGTGSGTMVEILNKIYDSYMGSIIVNFVGVPSKSISELPQESINACLSMYSLVESSTLCIMLDNGKTFDSVSRLSQFTGFNQINQIMRQHVSDFTSFLRFPNNHFSSYRKIACNFVPYSNLHFLNVSSSCEVEASKDTSLMIKTLDPKNLFYQSDLTSFRSMGSVMLSRGGRDFGQDKKQFNTWVKENEQYFVDWISSKTLYHHVETSNPYYPRSYSYIQNSKNSRELFVRMSNDQVEYIKDNNIQARYLKFGMDEMEFTEAESNLNDLCCEYIPWCGCFEEDEDAWKAEEEDIF